MSPKDNKDNKGNNVAKKRKKRRNKSRNNQAGKLINSTLQPEAEAVKLLEPITCFISASQNEEIETEASVSSSISKNNEPELKEASGEKKQAFSTIVCEHYAPANSHLNCSRFCFFSPNVTLLKDEDAKNYGEALQALDSLSRELALMVVTHTKSAENFESASEANEEGVMKKENHQNNISSLPKEDSLFIVGQKTNTHVDDQICQNKISALVNILDALPIQNNILSKKETRALRGMFKDVKSSESNKESMSLIYKRTCPSPQNT